jgi:hypothetical protein
MTTARRRRGCLRLRQPCDRCRQVSVGRAEGPRLVGGDFLADFASRFGIIRCPPGASSHDRLSARIALYGDGTQPPRRGQIEISAPDGKCVMVFFPRAGPSGSGGQGPLPGDRSGGSADAARGGGHTGEGQVAAGCLWRRKKTRADFLSEPFSAPRRRDGIRLPCRLHPKPPTLYLNIHLIYAT